MRGALGKKRKNKEIGKDKKKRSSLCFSGSLKSFLHQTLVYRDPQRHTVSLFYCCLSFSFPPFISSTSLHLYSQFAPGIPLSPSSNHSFAVQALICVCKELNSKLWIHFSSYHGFNKSNTAKAFQLH